MIATHAGFNPTDCNTMIIMINPALGTAAEPIDAAAAVNTMDYITIASTGDAIDFGDCSFTDSFMHGASDSHGGLGGF